MVTDKRPDKWSGSEVPHLMYLKWSQQEDFFIQLSFGFGSHVNIYIYLLLHLGANLLIISNHTTEDLVIYHVT